MILDWFCLGIAAYVAYRVAEEGAWGAVVVLISVLFSGLFAMNTFEPLAEVLEDSISDDPAWAFRWDMIALLGLFIGTVFLLRAGTDRLAPGVMRVPALLEFPIRWAAGAITAYLTIAILLTSLHVAPLPRVVGADQVWEPLGFQAERANVFGLAPDRQWLRFNQWLSQHGLGRGGDQRVFDGPVYHSGRSVGRWPSFPIRYADRREQMTRLRMGRIDAGDDP